VLLLAARRQLAPVALILAGLVISIYLGSINAMLVLFHHDVLSGLFLWQTGSMNQNDWSGVRSLLPFLGAGSVIAWLLSRPVQLLALGDEQAQGLGVSLTLTRLAAILTAVMLASAVTASVGVIGFIGLLGPLLARLSGAGRLLLWSALFGAGLLALADQAVQAIPMGGQLSTGTLTAALGAPLLLVMMRRLRPGPIREETGAGTSTGPLRVATGPILAGLVLFLAVCIVLALAAGRTPDGWQWTGLVSPDYLPWRLPRMLAALGAGAAFGIAGVLLQRLTGNAMASPEILGVSSGAAIGLVAIVMFSSRTDRFTLYSATSAGAFVTLILMLSLARRARFAPESLILVGIGVITLFSALSSVLLVSANPQATLLLSWLSGSTYRATTGDGVFVFAVALAAVAASPLMARWLSILPLGEPVSAALGVNVAAARFCVIIVAALTTAAGTLVVGPLGFIGLMAPHIVRLLGLRGGIVQIAGAAVAGAAITVLADWLGRNVAFPWQIPAGLASGFVGGTYLMFRLMRR
jgi:iron complex transport system permease protein